MYQIMISDIEMVFRVTSIKYTVIYIVSRLMWQIYYLDCRSWGQSKCKNLEVRSWQIAGWWKGIYIENSYFSRTFVDSHKLTER